MELRAYTDADFALTEALETDPEVMRELGGPTDRDALPAIHRNRLADPWWFTIVPEPGGPAIGTIAVWANAPSNALCRKFGFELLGATEFVYAGRRLQCNHWALPTPSDV